MIVYILRVTNIGAVQIGDGPGLAAAMPFGALPIDRLSVNIVFDILVAVVVQQFVSTLRRFVQHGTRSFECGHTGQSFDTLAGLVLAFNARLDQIRH